MASTYTGLGTELMTTGENAGDWGSKTNTNLQIIEQLAGGYTTQAVTTTTTLSVSDGSTGATLAHRVIKFTGTLSANATVTVPLDVQNLYILLNATSGAYTVTFKYVSGSGSTAVFTTTDKGTKIVYATADDSTDPNMVDTGISSNALTGITGDITIDSPADIILDADGADVILKDGGTQYGTLTNSSSNLLIKSGSTTAATFSGANVTLAGTVGSGAITSTGTVQGTTITATTAFVPDASDGAALGTSALEFSDLFLADGAVINFGDDQDVTLTHVADAGLLLNTTMYLTFRDSALKIHSSADGQLDIDADTEVEIAATTVDLNGILDVSGVIVAGGQISAADGSAAAPSISNTGDLNTGFLFSAADTMQFSSGGTAQVTFQDGAIVPVTDDDIDLGTASLQFKDVYIDGTSEADAITIGGSAVTAGAGAVTAMNNATANELVTIGGTTTELDAEANLTFTGSALTCIGTITVGADDAGHEVKFFGNAASAFMLWDASTDDLVLGGAAKLYLYDAAGGENISSDGTDLTIASGAKINLTATSDVVIPANVGITFGTGEKIEGDSTDLTITSGAEINLTATSDVHIPADVGIVFGTGEKIEGDSTDLTITSGADIALTATADINVPADVGITLGNDGEKIEGDGTDLTIASSGVLNLAAGGSTNQVKVTDGAILPITDDDVDLGSASYQFKNGYFDGTLEADALTIGGTAVTAAGATKGFAIALAVAL